MAQNRNGTSKQVVTTDGMRLAVREHGDRAKPTLLAVHGYPDDHSVWDGAVDVLADDHHVVVYDVRGAGASDVPEDRAAYSLDQLERDLTAVIEQVVPHSPVHLLAHDWGSIQAWHAITGAPSANIASLTSISGPCLDHVGAWFRSRLRQPTARGLCEALTQLAFSSYIGFFQLPAVPELAWRAGIVPRVLRALERRDPAATEPGRPSTEDGRHGLELYRANMVGRLRRPRARHASVPVQILAPTGDPFVSAALQTDVEQWVTDLRVRRITGGHWLPRTRPEVVARHTADFVEDLARGGATGSPPAVPPG